MAEKKAKKPAETKAENKESVIKEAENKESVSENYVTVDCNLLNIRHKPTKAAGVIMQAGKGEKFRALGAVEGGKWIRIGLPENRPEDAPEHGYVMAEFVS